MEGYYCIVHNEGTRVPSVQSNLVKAPRKPPRRFRFAQEENNAIPARSGQGVPWSSRPYTMGYNGLSGAGFEQKSLRPRPKNLLESREPYGIGLVTHAGVLRSTENASRRVEKHLKLRFYAAGLQRLPAAPPFPLGPQPALAIPPPSPLPPPFPPTLLSPFPPLRLPYASPLSFPPSPCPQPSNHEHPTPNPPPRSPPPSSPSPHPSDSPAHDSPPR